MQGFKCRQQSRDLAKAEQSGNVGKRQRLDRTGPLDFPHFGKSINDHAGNGSSFAGAPGTSPA